jgi:two-component sensor histidine kinase
MDHLVEDIRLVASELATNAVRHSGFAFTVGLDVRDHDVRLWVWDSSSSPPVRAAGDPMSTGGRGLALVEILSSQWGVAVVEGSKTVWATFDSDGRTSAALH